MQTVAPSGRHAAPSSRAVLPYPDWCTASTDGSPVSGSRTESFRITGLLVRTTRIVSNAPVLTGELNLDVRDYTVSSANLPNWQHQIGLSPWDPGLAFGGTRRTFSGCNINAPTGATGPSGASACMIPERDNQPLEHILATLHRANPDDDTCILAARRLRPAGEQPPGRLRG
ncbi:hypothetical protein [Couchioplanes azureus]|uniref:hypothetical protein n=1 Tax=Couchioplanes caeruleus TaxID=56438 RepID=UPI00166FCDA5|nr:hypothetical protein [Couchioplanes caeruleus]